MRAKRLGRAAAVLLLLLLGSARADANAVKGLYVGRDLYAPDESTQNAARASGFTRLFLSFFQVDDHGDITYDDTPVVQNGVYVGDPTWAEKLALVKKRPSGVHRLELAIGGGPAIGAGRDETTFANIRSLIASQGTGPSGILYRDLAALKEATGAEAVQLVDEPGCDAASVVAFGKMAAALGMKVSFCAYTKPEFWAGVKSELGTNVDAIYLMCYGDGDGNDPGSWSRALGGFPVCPVLWGNTDTTSSAMTKLRNWRQTCGIPGGVVWLNGFMPADAGRWASALSYGLDSIATLRIVNKNSGKSLNLQLGGMTNGAAIDQSAFKTGDDQRWMLVPTEQGDHFKIMSWVNGKSASIAFDSSMVGAQLWCWDYNNDSSQQFDLVSAGNGWFEIKNVRSGLVLEVAGGSTADNAVVQQNRQNGAASQMWKLYPCEATVLAAEDFDYPTGDLNGQNGGDGWGGDWLDVMNSGTKVEAGSLAGGTNVPAGYDARSLGNSAFIPNDKRVGRYLDCSAGGNFGAYGYIDSNGRIGAGGKSLYLSFLEQPSKTSLFYEFELDRGMERIAGIGNDTHTDDVNLRVPTDSFTSLGPGSTNVNFYVMRIDFRSGSDEVRVYRNPASELEPPQPTLTAYDVADMSFNRICLAAFANGNQARFDQIRIAGSWRDAIGATPELVTPTNDGTVDGGDFRQVRVSAQVLCGSDDKYYLMDGNTGFEVLLDRPAAFEPGDIVAATGLVECNGHFVSLIEAAARKTGRLPLPRPQPLTLLDSSNEALWVSVEGILTDFKDDATGATMEMQIGSQKLMARFQPKAGLSVAWLIGSRLRLTGVCLKTSDGQAGRANGDGFELLLNSPAAVELIASPPWWTLKRAMVAIGLLATGLALAFVWIRLLQGQVNRQTLRLQSEIVQRERAERERVIEEERSRISRDLHDDLGSILTQINMLANFTAALKSSPELMRERIRQISVKSHRMISALDEVVWMMHSKDESLSTLAAYLAAYTEEFLSKTSIICRIEAPVSYPDKAVTAEARNHVFSSVKEAVNNAVRHGKPGKVLLKLAVSEDKFEIQIQDDGCGFDPLNAGPGHGLANFRLRMQRVGGECRIQSAMHEGTTVILQVPLIPSGNSI